MSKKILGICLFCCFFLVSCSDEPKQNTIPDSQDETDVEASTSPTNLINEPQNFQSISDESKMKFVKITKNTAVIYKDPTTSSVAISTVQKDEKIPYLKELVRDSSDELWYKISLEDGAIGYIHEESAMLIESEQAATSAPIETKQVAKASTKKIKVDGSYIEITNGEGNIRKAPDLNAQVIFTGNYGDYLTFTNIAYETTDGRTWYEVYIDDYVGVGYISSAVSKVVEDYVHQVSYFIITSDGANIRAYPDINANVVYKANKGEYLFYLYDSVQTADGRIWYAVSVDGSITGYVSSITGYLDY